MKLQRTPIIIISILTLLLVGAGVFWCGLSNIGKQSVLDDEWKTVRGDDLQWQKNQKGWMNISFLIPELAQVDEVFMADSDNVHSLSVDLSHISPFSLVSVSPIAHVFSDSGRVSIIEETLRDVELGGFSKEFTYTHEYKAFAHVRGIQFDPIAIDGVSDVSRDMYIPAYILVKTKADVGKGEYSIYRFSLQYNSSIRTTQMEELDRAFIKMLDSVEVL
ncbi:MAG: hypothetical protein IPK84_04005 [Candidatus Moraniibacteriota bacterium]|nr:MAG: hypothetical protein IPK84_04005 [Candidatus Moranbacteria bacterium]